MLRTCCTCLALVATLLTIPPPGYAQNAMSADEKELAAYKLTMPMLKKVMAAMRSMAETASQDPQFQHITKVDNEIERVEGELDKLQSKDELTKAEEARVETLSEQLEKLREQKTQAEEKLGGGAQSSNPKMLSEMEQQIRSVPPMARALESQGVSPREYSKFMLAMMQAAMAVGFSQGNVDYAKLPPGINPDNVKFVEEHKAELEAMQKEFQALGKKGGN